MRLDKGFDIQRGSIKTDISRLSRLLIIIFSLLIVSWPGFWKNSRLPLKVQEVKAGQQEYTSGSGQFQAQITGDHVITLVGGGGGGGGPGNNGQGGGGGGGGSLCQVTVSLTEGNNYNYSVGTAGQAGAGDGTAGGSSTFNDGTTTYTAGGGGGGLDYNNGATGGSQGTTTNCGSGIANNGGLGGTGGAGSAGGGSGAGTSGSGNPGSIPTGGAAVSSYGGKGGDGSTTNNSDGTAGEAYGGGGGGGMGKNGLAAAGYAGYVLITWVDPVTLTQNDFLIYYDNDAIQPADVWGNPDLAENQSLYALPPSNDPIDVADEVRIRMSITVGINQLDADTEGFILQYGEGNDCGNVTWSNVSEAAGGTVWEFADSTPSNNASISATLLSQSDRAGRYQKSNTGSTNPATVLPGEDFEWDWHIEYVGQQSAATYCFRMRTDEPADLDGYNSDSYPQVDIRPSTDDFMRHGNFFTSGVERGLFWVD